MKIKINERWNDFLAAWSNKLTEARCDFWPDENKISLLQSAINKKLTKALISNHLLPEDDLDEWVRIVSKAAQRGEKAEKNLGWSLNQEEPESEIQPENLNGKSGREISLDDEGDVMMRRINTAKVAARFKGRAKWKSRAQLGRLREEGKCFRCERQGCTSRMCPLLPARRPGGMDPRINAVELQEIDPSVFCP
ncbi:hypothetical protein K3495_g2160 [Podosphaera aphanis]|nr:hypothetical protein K3495_g2160 [Podosphaera aphanis]